MPSGKNHMNMDSVQGFKARQQWFRQTSILGVWATSNGWSEVLVFVWDRNHYSAIHLKITLQKHFSSSAISILSSGEFFPISLSHDTCTCTIQQPTGAKQQDFGDSSQGHYFSSPKCLQRKKNRSALHNEHLEGRDLGRGDSNSQIFTICCICLWLKKQIKEW